MFISPLVDNIIYNELNLWKTYLNYESYPPLYAPEGPTKEGRVSGCLKKKEDIYKA